MPSFAVDEHIARSAIGGIRDLLSESAGISHSPSLPSSLLKHELLLVMDRDIF